MVALIDTNVIITYFADIYSPYKVSSKRVIELCANGKIDGYIAFHSVSNIWYILKRWNPDKRRRTLKAITDILTVTGADSKRVTEAIMMDEFHDFEDCLQYECAKEAMADTIITANVKDFTTVNDISIMTPDEVVRAIDDVQFE